jgi:hypothetical protein
MTPCGGQVKFDIDVRHDDIASVLMIAPWSSLPRLFVVVWSNKSWRCYEVLGCPVSVLREEACVD